ncbi:hydroxymethylpyrimidine phosphate synthase ThiC [Desulfocucumis palustris]|uniref:Phosphomethylpyrimidine synthase n=1 Tax=Desulfocucumis palustris TaxID=1898651 RepID=A0A2L2X914_9FIRM|nr:B12 lower ligand biosynthesis ThiC-like protein BzaB [Desulfocucumis palustris]GBF32608.1 hydroxymethylpyrimidine phosphate synthase ThiC [Desulfocucumis palustris]
MTQIQAAQSGKITVEMEAVAAAESVAVDIIRNGVASGEIVIPKNIKRKHIKVCGIGRGLRVKVNALIGTSSDRDSIEMEKRKLAIAEGAGCDAVMDLSTGGNIAAMRKQTLESAGVPVGSVPIYQAAIEAIDKRGAVVAMTAEDMFRAIEMQAAEGVDFMAIHCALNFDVIKRLQAGKRVTDVVSRGGAFLTGWMLHNRKENPLYEQFDRVLGILKEYDVTLSLGDAIRPGSTADSLDGAQLQGMIVAGELVARAKAAGVQVMVEGPGHVPMHHVETTMLLQKRLCDNAPYFILGTLATDIAPGYDHITSAIGGAIAGAAGADFICYVTPAEHLGLPGEEDVREGVIAARIAAHAANIARGHEQSRQKDFQMACSRTAGNTEGQIKMSIDPARAAAALEAQKSGDISCALCGDNCTAEIAARYFGIIR